MPTPSSHSRAPLRGVYGLRIAGSLLDEQIERDQLVEAGATWPRWEISWEPPTDGEARGTSPVERWSPDRAELAAQPSGRTVIDRILRRTTLFLAEPPLPQAVIHPYLASTGVVAGHWLGKTPFHAGSFEFGGRAWGVLGGREMGKSSLLMSLHRFGIPILSDDLLVLNGEVAYAGPRCLDLRQSAAEHFEAGEYIGVVGTRDRWRVALPPVRSEVPFGGWVLIGWSDEVSFDAPPPSHRLSALAAHRGLIAHGAPADGLLDLLEYPMVLFARPQDWDHLDGATAQLLERLRAFTT
jgi:hypothetical protein